jgi:hypothetical protein
MDQLRRIAELHGVFLHREALALGLDGRTISRLIGSRSWHRVRHGAYTMADMWAELTPSQRDIVRARAAYRSARRPVALSHTSALSLLGARMWDLDMAEVHLTRLDGKHGRREAGIARHRGWSGVEDLAILDGLQITSATRTALDITTITDVEHSLVVVDGLLATGETTPEHLARRYATMVHWPDTLATELVLSLADGRSDSVGETRVRYHCWHFGLPAPVPQLEVRERGIMRALLDLAWPEHKVWVEFDGKEKYTKFLRDGESASDAVFREKKREDMIRRLTGWTCVRIVWADLFDPARMVAKIAAALAGSPAVA